MSDASCQQDGATAAALEDLEWLDDDEAAALETLFGAGDECDAPAPLRCSPRPTSPLSDHDSEGGSSGHASTAARAPQCLASPRGQGAAPCTSARLDGLRFLDADCARGCSKCAPLAPHGTAGGLQRGTQHLFARELGTRRDAPRRLTRDALRPRRCISAPPIASEGLYQLVGDVGKARARERRTRAWRQLLPTRRGLRAPPPPRADAPAAPAPALPQKNGEKKLRRCALGPLGRSQRATRGMYSWRVAA
jgi:hypothetical protein